MRVTESAGIRIDWVEVMSREHWDRNWLGLLG